MRRYMPTPRWHKFWDCQKKESFYKCLSEYLQTPWKQVKNRKYYQRNRYEKVSNKNFRFEKHDN